VSKWFVASGLRRCKVHAHNTHPEELERIKKNDPLKVLISFQGLPLVPPLSLFLLIKGSWVEEEGGKGDMEYLTR
jgi:hypothetical protein